MSCISAANYICIYAHMLMRKPSNFHCTLTSIRLIFLLQETEGNVLNTDDFFRCPHGTQEL